MEARRRGARRLSGAAAWLGALALAAGAGSGCGGGGKAVVCPAGQADCGGTCRDLQSDPVSCGACGLRCAAGGVCAAGTCGCPPPTTLCGATCIDLSTSATHCGTCTHDCGAGTCSAGACTCSPAPTVADCTPAASPQCRDTQADRSNCGGCGVACLANEICAASACQACAAPTPDRCGNSCLDLQTDHGSCGTCGHACGAAQTCAAGACACPAGLAVCGSACADLQNDAANCGACGHACPAGQGCSGGTCSCAVGQTCGALCCEGTACCGAGGTACQTKHDNGAGAVFYDCNPPGSAGAALGAALAWRPGGHASSQVGASCSFTAECLAWEDAPSPSACAVWCYAGIFAGRVAVTTINPICLCPTDASPSWH